MRAVHDGVHVGIERTLQQDVAFGIRQLVDIAARSLSPGINDPTTAVAALGAMSTVLAELLGRDLDARVALDDGGRVRAVVDQPNFGELPALARDQPRRYGRTEPAVLTEVLRLLTDLAEITDDRPAARSSDCRWTPPSERPRMRGSPTTSSIASGPRRVTPRPSLTAGHASPPFRTRSRNPRPERDA